jgi:hypothetical protein
VEQPFRILAVAMTSVDLHREKFALGLARHCLRTEADRPCGSTIRRGAGSRSALLDAELDGQRLGFRFGSQPLHPAAADF